MKAAFANNTWVTRGGTSSFADALSIPAFLNVMLEQTWPCISEYAVHVLQTVIEPEVQRALGRVGSQFRFDHNECHLGNQPAQFTEIVVNKTTQVTEHGTLNNVVLRGNLRWEGDISIMTHFAGVPAGVKSVTLSGVLMIEFVGMLPRPPVFQGVRAFFLNPPDVDMGFHGGLHPLRHIQTIKRKILQEGVCQVSKMLVVPNRMGALLEPSADFFRIMRPCPKGLLRLRVLRATDLLGMDKHWFKAKTSDPYCLVQCGAQRVRSHTIAKSLSPSHDFHVWLGISSVRHQRALIEFWDEDLGFKDDFLGAAELPVGDLISHAADEETWVDLADEVGVPGRGKVCVTAEWRPFTVNRSNTPTDLGMAGFVLAGIYSAHHLPGEPEGSRYWITAGCSNEMASNSLPAEGGSRQCSKKLLRRPPPDPNSSEAKEAAARMGRKLEILRRYHLAHEDMAEVLDVDAEHLQRQASTIELQAATRHNLHFNQPFEFLVSEMDKAILSFEVHCQGPGRGVKEKVLGSAQFPISQLLDLPGGRTLQQMLPVPGTEMSLKAHFQLRFLGSAQVLNKVEGNEDEDEDSTI